MNRKIVRRRGRYQLTMYAYALGRKSKCEYVVSYGTSRFNRKSAEYRGIELFVTDSIQTAIDNLLERKI